MTQIINAIGLPLVFYFLIRLTSRHDLMGRYVNSAFQRNFATVSSIVIVVASVFTVMAAVFWS